MHSPFIYSLIRDVFKNKTPQSLVKRVEKSRREYRSDKRSITVNDLGSGSLKLKSRDRKISEIAKYASVRPAYGSLISRLASEINGKSIIELGTSLGIGSMYLALGAPDSKVYTIEGCENTASLARDMFMQKEISNIQIIIGSFEDHLEDVLDRASEAGLVYIDGNHRSDALLRYMEVISGYIAEDTIVIVDDIHYSKDMEEGWERLKRMKSVSVSIDLLQMGLLFFRRGIPKQDKVIRY